MESTGKRFAGYFILVLFALSVLALSANSAVTSSGEPHCVYRSPLPHAILVSPSANLIMRFDAPVAAASLGRATLNVEGSSSGRVDGTLSLSDDGRTVLYQPGKELVGGETVHAKLSAPLLSRKACPKIFLQLP